MRIESTSPETTTFAEHDIDFLIQEGLDMLASYRTIRSAEMRKAIRMMIAAIRQMELEDE